MGDLLDPSLLISEYNSRIQRFLGGSAVLKYTLTTTGRQRIDCRRLLNEFGAEKFIMISHTWEDTNIWATSVRNDGCHIVREIACDGKKIEVDGECFEAACMHESYDDPQVYAQLNNSITAVYENREKATRRLNELIWPYLVVQSHLFPMPFTQEDIRCAAAMFDCEANGGEGLVCLVEREWSPIGVFSLNGNKNSDGTEGQVAGNSVTRGQCPTPIAQSLSRSAYVINTTEGYVPVHFSREMNGEERGSHWRGPVRLPNGECVMKYCEHYDNESGVRETRARSELIVERSAFRFHKDKNTKK
jgi:hypothetical protein